VLEVLVVIAIVAYVIGRQVLGEPLRGKRVLLLPAILTVIGLTRLDSGGRTVQADDVAFLVVGAVVALAIGAAQGGVMHLESRDGGLWGRMPLRGLWLWVALVGARVALTVLASASGAHVAASTAPIVLLLGVNRLGQAAIITRRAHASGIAFSPEKDGTVFLADRLGQVNSRLDGLGSGPAADSRPRYADPRTTTGRDNVTDLSDLPPRPNPFGDSADRRYERATRRYDRRTARRRYR
jgi:hypothetical protein